MELLIARLPDLQSLDLRNTRLHADTFVFAHKAIRLQSLNLANSARLHAFSLAPRFNTLRVLSLSNSVQLGRVTIDAPLLDTLNLSQSRNLQTVTLTTPLLATLNLRSVDRSARPVSC